MPDAPQPVAVHRLIALSGGTDLGGYWRVIDVDVDGFFAAEPSAPANKTDRNQYGANDHGDLPRNGVVTV